MKTLLRAEAAVNNSPFAGCTPEAARRSAQNACRWKYQFRGLELFLSLLGSLALGSAAAALLIWKAFSPLASALTGSCVAASILASCFFYLKHWHRRAHHIFCEHSYSTTNADAISALCSTYLKQLEERDSAQSELDKRSAAADTLYNSISTNEQAILLEIRRFAPAAYDLSSADALLRGCAIRRKELADAENALREAILRQSILPQDDIADTDDVAPPQRPQTTAAAELAEVSAALGKCRGSIQHLSGQLAAHGDAAQLRAEIQTRSHQLEQLNAEYSALHLAMETLEHANQIMQNRFAPTLGKRTAQLFHQMTEGRYQNVVLDRSLRLSAEPSGDHMYRDSSLLSSGAIDQLYLAARLAICETVLPATPLAPIVLDDALANFDDQRCAAALQLLKEEALHRQILLFTCHSREADFFSGDKEVTILQLTNPAEKV